MINAYDHRNDKEKKIKLVNPTIVNKDNSDTNLHKIFYKYIVKKK